MSDPNGTEKPSPAISRRDAIAGGLTLSAGLRASASAPVGDSRFVVVGGWVLTRDDLARLGADRSE